MRKILLLIFIVPFTVKAQFLPQLNPLYNNPNNLNLPLDSNYVPGPYYVVQNYRLDANNIDWILQSHYDIETNNYLLTKSTQTYDFISSNLKYDQYITSFFYENGKIKTRNNYRRFTDSNTLKINSVDSFLYQNELITLIKNNRLDDTTAFVYEGTEFIYDSLGRVFEKKPYNYKPLPNYSVSGYFLVDSFNLNNQPIKVNNYQIDDTITKTIQSAFLDYDTIGRITSIVFYSHIFQNSPPIKMDSLVHYYSGNKIYPDSTIGYSFNNSKFGYSYKTIYNYLQNGKISEIWGYRYNNDFPYLTSKSIYTKSFPTSIKKANEESLEAIIYPNPSNGNFMIKTNNFSEKISVNIINILGEIVYQNDFTNTNEITINENLKSGLYFIQLVKDNKQTCYKILINN